MIFHSYVSLPEGILSIVRFEMGHKCVSLCFFQNLASTVGPTSRFHLDAAWCPAHHWPVVGHSGRESGVVNGGPSTPPRCAGDQIRG